MEEELWWWGGVLLVTLSMIYLEFNAHLTSIVTTAFYSDTPTHLVVLSGTIICSQQDNDPKYTSRLCKGNLTKKESDGVLHQMTWPPQSPNLNPIEGLGWVGPQSEGKASNKCSAYVGTASRLLRFAGWENAKSVQGKETLLLLHMCYFIVLMSSLLFYNVENSINKDNLLNE